MTRKNLITVVVTLVAMTALPALAQAATCSMPWHSNSSLGDSMYGPRVCNQSHVNKFWNDFDFDKGDWDDGFGYYSVCDINRPLNRAFSSLWLLLFSSPNPATSTSDMSGNFLRYAYNYSAREIDELDGRCGNGGTSGVVARTYQSAFVNDRTQLEFPFFYGQGVPERAGTIVHEARHADGRRHNSCSCPRGGSCDQRWLDKGANSYENLYMWWFVDRGINTTTTMKRRAQHRVNNLLARAFCTRTSFRLNYSL